MIKVTLRKKPISNGRISLYLDYYPAIAHPDTGKPTRREFLGLYLFNRPKTQIDKDQNSETLQLAETVRSQRQIAAQNGAYGFLSKRVTPASWNTSASRLPTAKAVIKTPGIVLSTT